MKRTIAALVLGAVAPYCFAEDGSTWREPPPGDYGYELVVTAPRPRPLPVLESSEELAARIHQDDAFNLAAFRSTQQIAGVDTPREPPPGHYDYEVIVTAPVPPALPALESSEELAARVSQDAALYFAPYATSRAVVSE